MPRPRAALLLLRLQGPPTRHGMTATGQGPSIETLSEGPLPKTKTPMCSASASREEVPDEEGTRAVSPGADSAVADITASLVVR